MSDKILGIIEKAKEMREVGKEINRLKQELEIKEKSFKEISENTLPIMMAEIGLKQFALDDGTSLVIKPIFVVNTPSKAKINIVDEWLKENGYDGMVKSNITSDHVAEIKQILDEEEIPYNVNKSINWQTLNAWGREMEMEGKVIPEDIFTIYRSNKTVIE